MMNKYYNRNRACATFVEDLGIYMLSLSAGSYEIDGERFETENGQRLQVTSIDSIYRIEKTQDLYGYKNDKGDEIFECEYEELKAKHLSNRVESEWGETVWKTMENEADYRNFLNEWEKIYKDNETKNKVEITPSRIIMQTGNKYIESPVVCGDICREDSDKLVYRYDRKIAVVGIAHEIFKSLSMEAKPQKVDYGDTNNKKIYGCEDSGSIRFWTAFGTYPFGDAFDRRRDFNGSLKECKDLYNDDYEELSNLIKYKYSIHFNTMNESTAISVLKDVLCDVRKATNYIEECDPKVKNQSSHYAGLKIMRSIQTKANAAIAATADKND